VWEIGSDDKSLIQPLTSIKGLGDKAVEQILQHRPFNNVEELLFNDDIVYSKLNKKALDVLARCGAMNCLMDERFTGMKHFWSAVAVDRPKKEKDLNDNIELYKPEGDFSDMEKIEYLTGLTGIFPFSLVLKNDVYDSIKKNKIPAWESMIRLLVSLGLFQERSLRRRLRLVNLITSLRQLTTQTISLRLSVGV